MLNFFRDIDTRGFGYVQFLSFRSNISSTKFIYLWELILYTHQTYISNFDYIIFKNDTFKVREKKAI